MPNVILEHSSDIKDTKELMQLCHDHLMESGLFKLSAVKIRSIGFDQHLVAGKEGKTFLAGTVYLLPGRPKEKLKELGDGLQKKLLEKTQSLQLISAVSVAVKETPEGLYFTKNLDEV